MAQIAKCTRNRTIADPFRTWMRSVSDQAANVPARDKAQTAYTMNFIKQYLHDAYTLSSGICMDRMPDNGIL